MLSNTPHFPCCMPADSHFCLHGLPSHPVMECNRMPQYLDILVHDGSYLFWQPPHRMPAIIAKMFCLCGPQQGSPEKAESARASACRVPGPHMPFSFSTPHFCVPRFDAACMCCWKSALNIALLHIHVLHIPLPVQSQRFSTLLWV